MWNVEQIEFENLFSHKNSQYTFQNNKCVVIFGENKDQAGFENNGAGKTTLFEAIALALTNETLRGVNKEEFINYNADWCRVKLDLYNTVMQSKLTISRKFFRGGKAVKVEIYENGELNRQITSVTEANKYVYDVIGISRDDLLKYFIISQDNHYTFFTASDGDKKEVMNRITSADMVNPVLENLTLELKSKQAEYNDINSKLDKAVGKLELLEEQRENIIAADSTVDKIQEKKLELKKIDNIISQLKAFRSKEKTVDVFGIKQTLKEKKLAVETVEEQIAENTATKRHLEMELGGKVICPKCKHKFIPNSSLDLPMKEIERLIKETEKELNKQESVLLEKKEEVKILKKQISDAEAVNDYITELDFKIRKQERRKKDTLEEINELDEKVKNNSDVVKVDEEIKIVNDKIKSLKSTLSPINSEIEIIKFWQFYLGRSGFKTYLANKSIKIIEGMTNNFLKKFGVDMRILINGFKVLASGDVREKIDVFILEDGIQPRAYMARSGGERGRVILAGILAIHKLINMSTDGRGLNLLLLDECFPGMDSLGQENIIKIFERIGITSLIITQTVSDGFNIKNTLRVVKQKGVSRYIQG